MKDGRKLDVAATIAPPRPKLTLIGKGVEYDDPMHASPIRMEGQGDLPNAGRLVFHAKSEIPETFPRTQSIEIAAGDDPVSKRLTITDGTLILQDARTAIGIVDLAKVFGVAAFGPLRFRPVDANGIAGDWQPLGTLVRLPELGKLSCPRAISQPCILTGTNLFLLSAVSNSAEFTDPVTVPQGSSGSMLAIPHVKGNAFYVQLRDNPSSTQKVEMPVSPLDARSVSSGNDPGR